MADIGATLRDARMRAKIDINEVERRTKIRAKYLRAIENEEWDLLPGDVYARSFLRTYGDFLGLDSRGLIDDYRRRYERPSDSDTRPITPRSRERDRGGGRRRRGLSVPPWAVIGLVLVGVIVLLYIVGRKSTQGTPTATIGTHGQAHRRATHHGRTGASSKTTATGTTHRHRPTTVHLQLVATGPVYVCLVDGTGRKLIPGQTFSAGQTIPPETARSMLLTLGNASVQMKINGHPVAVAPSSSAIGYRLTPRGHSLLPASQQPTCA